MNDQDLRQLCDRLIEEINSNLPEGKECVILVRTVSGEDIDIAKTGDRLIDVLHAVFRAEFCPEV